MRLFIDGKEYPVDCNAGFSLNYDDTLTHDIDAMRSGAKVEITIPATTETDILFADAVQPLAAERFASAIHYAVITVEGMEMVSGVIRLKQAVGRGGAATHYRAEILTGAPQWVKNAAQTMLHDTPVKYECILSPAEMCRTWTDDSPVKFFPVHHDSYRRHHSSVSIMPPEKIMMTDDYHPFISVEAVVRAVFESAGYSISSRFIESDLFRSLYMSGAFAHTDTSAHRRNMDFVAGRTEDVSAVADDSGRVYASAVVVKHSLGNLVDTAASEIQDGDASQPTGFFSNNGCFSLVKGVAAFTPLTAVNVGFEYNIAYVTDYVIESRSRLRGFNTIYLENGVHVPFTLANRFKDYRNEAKSAYEYKLMIFDNMPEGTKYRLDALIDGKGVVLAETSERMCKVVTPPGSAPQDIVLMYYSSTFGKYRRATNDWALYAGYIEYRGRTEVEITLQTPTEELNAMTPRRFEGIYFEGADPGMTLTLLKRTTMRPIFSSRPGYGSRLSFADMMRYGVRQTALLQALQQMFNLRFMTDENTRTVFIEPYDDFYGDTVAEWSDKIDFDADIFFEDPSLKVHQRRSLAYRDGEGAVLRFEKEHNTSFADWCHTAASTATLEGEQASINPLFAPTLNGKGHFYNAEDAFIIEVSDSDDADDDTFITPRIVRFAGIQPLPAGQRWGYPYSKAAYPLAAFHLAEECGTARPFTLCFCDRDGLTGLNRYYTHQLACEERGLRITLRMHLTPADAAALFDGSVEGPSVRSLFRLRTGGQSALYTLEAVENYNPATGYARCTFLKTDNDNQTLA